MLTLNDSVPNKSLAWTYSIFLFLFTWCVCPAGVHAGEVDLFVLRGPRLCQNHLLSLSKKKKKNDNTKHFNKTRIHATMVSVQLPGVQLF